MTPKRSLVRLARRGLDALGLEVRRKPQGGEPSTRPPVELTPEHRRMLDHVRSNKLSMASNERLWATTMACQHVVDAGIVNAAVVASGAVEPGADLIKISK